MSTIKYQLEFFSHWHCGSGQAAGADVDTLVIKDRQGLPYVPGKTLKGLIREAATIVSKQQGCLDLIFGISGKSNGKAYFGNATLPKSESDYIIQENLMQHLYQSFSSTAINDDGIAQDKSLRKTETVVPCKLEGVIMNIPDNQESKNLLIDAMNYIKRMGSSRNRGFGRCKFSVIIIEKEEEK